MGVLAHSSWLHIVESSLKCPVTLINDAEAFVLGLASIRSIRMDRNVGVIVVGTGLGFSVVRMGRLWKPGRRLHLFGLACTESTSYDGWISASSAAGQAGGDLKVFLSEQKYAAQREIYLRGLARVVVGLCFTFVDVFIYLFFHFFF